MLQLIEITKKYITGELVQTALNGVSFSLRDNEFVSILGPSGSGKTTLLNIIGGLDRYDSGDLVINGISTKKYKNRDWDAYRNHTIGFVFQNYNLIPHQNILANVELALTIGGMSVRERKKKAKQALEEVGLGDQIHKKPNQLSGGQMQRVAIARALVNDPDILLADEPTGALDSETSLQIMELLKKVAANRLVVMVTHNAELAEEYSTRIIRLKDGQIVSDSHPFDPAAELDSAQMKAAVSEPPADSTSTPAVSDENGQNAAEFSKDSGEPDTMDSTVKSKKEVSTEQPTETGSSGTSTKKEKARMSFLTSLSLSGNNLRSKKGRTILISLASSIGIIGIALILSISTGVNDYIYKIQKDAMTSYPITIDAQTIDLNSLMSEGFSFQGISFGTGSSTSSDDGSIHGDYSTMESEEAFSTSLVENNLTGFKKYLDDPESDIRNYLGENGIVYTYDVSFDVYTHDAKGMLQNTDASVSDIVVSDNAFSSMSSGLELMRSSGLFGLGQASSGASNFSQMAQGANGKVVSQVVLDNYDLLAGQWPEQFNEVVLVLNGNSTLPAETMYQLGLMDGNTYQDIASKIQMGEEAPDFSWTYEDALNRTFYLVTASDHYADNGDGTFTYLDESYLDQEVLMKNAVELKVTGIIRPKEDATAADITTAVAYTYGLTDYCIDHTINSPVILAQEADPETNVLTGMSFTPADDEQKAQDAIAYIHTMPGSEKAQLFALISYYEEQQNGSSDEEGEDTGIKSGMLSSESSLEDLMDMFGLSDNPVLSGIMMMLGEDTLNEIMSNVSFLATDESQQSALLDQWLDEDPDPEILLSLYDRYSMGGSYDENMDAFGMISYDAPTSISIYTDTFENKDSVIACIDNYNARHESDDRIVYTDYISLLTSSITQIVNAISYILIAFVAVSLLVSCIMIGIITHISVMERTREIGILRAIGASRANISQVFNAETVIIGLIAGLLGVLISWLLTIPINLILKGLVGSDMINVHLPILYALLLIAISVAVTVIGGIIPSARASRKDPVIALRSE